MLTVLFSPLMITVTLPVALPGTVMTIVPLPVSLTLMSSGVVCTLDTLSFMPCVELDKYQQGVNIVDNQKILHD
jgi:hypothetical protein